MGAAVSVENGHAFAREVLEKAFAHDLNDPADGRGVIVGVQEDEYIDFANTDELAEKVIGKDGLVGHLQHHQKRSEATDTEPGRRLAESLPCS